MKILILASLLSTSAQLLGQSFWLPRSRMGVAVEAFKINIDGNNSNASFITSAFFVSWRFTVFDRISLTGDLPIARINYWQQPRTVLGNPYFGLLIGRSGGSLIGEIGFRSLNISKDDPAFFSLGPVDADRFEAFKSAFTLLGRLDYLRQVRGNLAARIRGGLSWVIITVGEDAQSDLFYDYGLQIGYEKRPIHFYGGISGRIPLVEDESATTIESYHQFVLSIGAAFSLLRPGIQLRIPVNDAFRKMEDLIFSVSLAVQVR